MGAAGSAYRDGSSPTVLLVHGGFADASSWAGVIPALLAAGLDVLAPANPLRGLAADAGYVAGVAGEIDGPVLLAGHAYGGAVITAAGAQAGNVVGLVYVAAFAPDAGESVLDVAGRFPASRLGPALRPATSWGAAGEPGVELYVKRDAFPAVLAADLPESVTAVLAVTQRPIAAAALEEKAPGAAWRVLPSWYAVAAADQAIHPDAQRFMARRAGARTVEVDASHTVLLSRAGLVADLVRTAAGGSPATSSRPARAQGPLRARPQPRDAVRRTTVARRPPRNPRGATELMAATNRTIVLIHGLWMTPRSWERWVERYTAKGYRVLAPTYPGLEVEVEALRDDPSPIAPLTVGAVADHLEGIVRGLEQPPILIGHSFGGTLVQLLLHRGCGVAGVAINSAPTEGVRVTPLSQVKAIFPILQNPANWNKAVGFTPEQFHFAFTNTLSPEESAEVYERYAIAAPARIVWTGILGNVIPGHQEAWVDYANDARAPLLFIAGGADNIMPASVNRSNAKHYERSSARTEYKEFPGRSHFTCGEAGWEAVADDALEWATEAAAAASTEAPPPPPAGR